MKLILATSNMGKVKEIQKFFINFEVIPYTNLIEAFEIEESGSTFKENAVIKVEAVHKALAKININEIIIADDSGISVEALNWEPNIYSARYAGVNASSSDNVQKIISQLKNLSIKESKAFYTAAIALIDKDGNTQTTHGWMHGKVIQEISGNGGFGYDPIFIPDGENKTLGLLNNEVKAKYSHRIKALKLVKIILEKQKNV